MLFGIKYLLTNFKYFYFFGQKLQGFLKNYYYLQFIKTFYVKNKKQMRSLHVGFNFKEENWFCNSFIVFHM